MGGGWQRAPLVAKEADPHRIARLAWRRLHHENWQAHEGMVLADARDLHLLPQVGTAWRLPGTQAESMPPGTHEKHALAGALPLAPGKGLSCLGPRKNNEGLRDLLTLLDTAYPAAGVTRISVVVDNDCIHKAKAVEPWWARHPRFALVWWPPYGPRATPIARVCGEVHDKCTRNHKRQRVRDVIQDVERHVQVTGPWRYHLAQLYGAPAVTAAVEHITAEKHPTLAA